MNPVLLYDSPVSANCWYFGDGTRFVPDDRYERAQVLQWMFFEQYEHEPAIAVVRFWVASPAGSRSSRTASTSGERRATER